MRPGHYRGGKLVGIAMAGTGSADNASTLVQDPAGATRVGAMAWDGKRTLVCGQRWGGRPRGLPLPGLRAARSR